VVHRGVSKLPPNFKTKRERGTAPVEITINRRPLQEVGGVGKRPGGTRKGKMGPIATKRRVPQLLTRKPANRRKGGGRRTKVGGKA